MTWRESLLLGIAAITMVAAAFVEPIPQDVLYHQFIDSRHFAGLPNFLNVLSNLPFLLVGIAGMQAVRQQRIGSVAALRPAWFVFFLAVAMTAFGSGYYHFNPSNTSLIWDRVPMTLAFMSLATILIAEYYSARNTEYVLGTLLLIGIGSVLYWAYTETQGRGDLRPYAIVQFLPMILIPILLLLYPRKSDLGRYVWGMIGLYVVAKLAEHFDIAIFAAGNIVSGHSLKHVIASLAPAYLLLGLLRRPHSDG